MKKKIMGILLTAVLSLSVLAGCGVPSPTGSNSMQEGTRSVLPAAEEEASLNAEGSYTTKEDVALYLELYDSLPDNFITKKEARDMGWQGGSLEPYAPGFCIGGDHYGNYEGALPKNGDYRECDINTMGADSRGAERLVYDSEDGDVTAIYYTDDHYKTFEKIYEE